MLKESAVVVLHEQATDSIVLTKRSTTLRDHPGEICFPGGVRDPSDTDLWATALRELWEELQIDPDRVNLITKLNPEHTLSGTMIQPWLATIPVLEPYVTNHHEVEEVLMLPIQKVRDENNYRNIIVERVGRKVTTLQFMTNRYFIWGATVRIMKQLCKKSSPL